MVLYRKRWIMGIEGLPVSVRESPVALALNAEHPTPEQRALVAALRALPQDRRVIANVIRRPALRSL